MEIDAVARSYRRWAPVYDFSFGAVSRSARRHVVNHVSRRGGEALEVGIGTGLALPLYDGRVRVTGIDYSDEMLARARKKVAEEGLTHVGALHQMDARALDFADGTFDTVVAMFLVSVVPDPEQVMSEMARVCRPGGEDRTGLLAVREHARLAFRLRQGAGSGRCPPAVDRGYPDAAGRPVHFSSVPASDLNSQPARPAARPAPASCASTKAGTSTGRIPAKLSLKARASVTAGLAKLVDEVNQ